MKNFITLSLILLVVASKASTKRILFIGNSYTYVNNLPQLLYDLALSAGDTIVYDSNTPGGYTLQSHCTNATTLSKISLGNWDYVILQEQSQNPAFSPQQVASDVLPYAKRLDSLIHISNNCCQTVFYMTWGRINGDASNCAFYPPICTYLGMQQRLKESYLLMANNNSAVVSPVGEAWKNVRALYPNINLYSSDGSHPSIEGSYLAACVFYTSIFKTSCVGLSFTSTVTPSNALILQQIASETVLDSIDYWNTNIYYPQATFSYLINNNVVTFQSQNNNALSYVWNFGDGNIGQGESISHTYNQAGLYQITLTTSNNCFSNSFIQQVNFDSPTSNKSIEVSSNKIWLNQINKCIEFKNDNEVMPLQYRIMDVSGHIVKHELISINRIDISQLPVGFYLLSINSKTYKFALTTP